MTGPAGEERDPSAEQRFRNRVSALVIGGVIAALALAYLALLPGFQGYLGGLCAFAFLAFAFVAWEFLMKPGYGPLHRQSDPEPEPPHARKEPRSPRPP